MARRKLKQKKKQRDDAESTRFGFLRLGGEHRSRTVRGAVWLAAIGCVAIGICIGLARLETRVHALDRYDRSLTLRWVDLPDWLQLPDNKHILDGLARRVDLRAEDRLLDPCLAERLGRVLCEPTVGWIKSVDRVAVEPDGVVSIRCKFRRPVSWVQHGRYCYLVDAEGVRLPGRYAVSDCDDSSLMLIEAVRLDPPATGSVWRGADLAAGLRLVTLLTDKPFRHQIVSVDVANHDGRCDRSRPHIELATDRAGSRVWWGRPPDEEFGTEITASQKITLLDTLYRQWGRIDMNRSYVNIMTWPDRIAMPATERPAKNGRLLRG